MSDRGVNVGTIGHGHYLSNNNGDRLRASNRQGVSGDNCVVISTCWRRGIYVHNSGIGINRYSRIGRLKAKAQRTNTAITQHGSAGSVKRRGVHGNSVSGIDIAAVKNRDRIVNCNQDSGTGDRRNRVGYRDGLEIRPRGHRCR